MVILPAGEFDSMIEELEDFADIQLYHEAKKDDDGERIPMQKAFEMIESPGKANLTLIIDVIAL